MFQLNEDGEWEKKKEEDLDKTIEPVKEPVKPQLPAKPTVQCYACKEYGHYANKCLTRKRKAEVCCFI